MYYGNGEKNEYSKLFFDYDANFVQVRPLHGFAEVLLNLKTFLTNNFLILEIWAISFITGTPICKNVVIEINKKGK